MANLYKTVQGWGNRIPIAGFAIMLLGFASAFMMERSSPTLPTTQVSQRDADRQCGGTATYHERTEDSGDPEEVIGSFYRCPDNSIIPANV